MDCPREIRHVMVNSKNRDTAIYPSGNSYVLHLTTPIKDISRIELLHASIPNSMNNLTNGTGIVYFSNATTGTVAKPSLTSFSLPSGFYSATNMASSITQAVSNISGVQSAYIASQGKMIFSRPTSTGPFSMCSNTAEMSNLLGFNSEDVRNSSNVAATTGLDIPLYSDNSFYLGKEFIISDNVVDLNPYEGIFLDIKELRTNTNEDAKSIEPGTSGTYSGQNMTRSFGMIPMDVSSGNIKRFKKTTDYDFTIDYAHPIDKLDRLSIEWIDKNGALLDFNGLEDNSFLLRFHTLRKNFCK